MRDAYVAAATVIALRSAPSRPTPCLPTHTPRRAKLLRDANAAFATVIALRNALPTADLAAMIARQPRLLLRDPGAVAADAEAVRAGRGPRVRLGTRQAPGSHPRPQPAARTVTRAQRTHTHRCAPCWGRAAPTLMPFCRRFLTS